ncbi:hypothetical protein GCM10023116_08880 [Kistimonas scapharcae]|uniref:Uncharacterized protein n=2 Tax=Kistimonas scapharcae TaxID=1036133 RepID=A0ABP8UZ53_9GAMM
MDAIDFLWTQVTHKMADEMRLETVAAGKVVTCYCCGRASGRWSTPLFEMRVDSYTKLDVAICAPCNALFHGSYRYLGIEKGTIAKPATPGKLGMLVGCGMIVTQRQSILLTNPGWHSRLSAASEPIFQTVQESGKSAMEFVLQYTRELDEDAFPLLYVSDLGRKKTELVENLQLTYHWDELYACTANQTHRINLILLDQIRALSKTDKTACKKLVKLVRGSCLGHIPPNAPEITAFLTSHPEALNIARKLPCDPHEKLHLLSIA